MIYLYFENEKIWILDGAWILTPPPLKFESFYWLLLEEVFEFKYPNTGCWTGGYFGKFKYETRD